MRYQDRRGRPKHVRYWRMTPRAEGTFTPNEEVDEVRWLSLPEAATLLSYDADRRLLSELRTETPGPHRREPQDPEEQGAGEHR